MPVKVSAKVLEGLDAIRKSGRINMFDYWGVMRLADQSNYAATFSWMYCHQQDYIRGIFEGFEVDNDEG